MFLPKRVLESYFLVCAYLGTGMGVERRSGIVDGVVQEEIICQKILAASLVTAEP